jgi:hypothetical protein
VETKFVGDFGDGHGVGEILFVAQDEESRVSEFVFSQHLLEFEGGFVDSLAIVGIDNEDDSFGVVVIVSPQGSNLVLTSNIPNGEAERR